MFGKKKSCNDSYALRAKRRLIMDGNTQEAMRIILDGFEDYQKKIVEAVCPYPTADTSLLVIILRSMADSLYDANPDCHGFVEWIDEKVQLNMAEKKAPAKKR